MWERKGLVLASQIKQATKERLAKETGSALAVVPFVTKTPQTSGVPVSGPD